MGTSSDVAHRYQDQIHHKNVNDDIGQCGTEGGITVLMVLGKKIQAIVWST